MNNRENMLNFIAESSNTSIGTVKRYYDILKGKACVDPINEYQVFNCLYLLIQLRKKENKSPLRLPLDYSVSEALYKTYKDGAYDDLTPSFIITNDVQKSLKLMKQ